MDSLKIRVWVEELKTFADDVELYNDGSYCWYVGAYSGSNTNTYLMRCTGIKDKNGVLIWEDDLVRIKHPRDIGGDFGDTIGLDQYIHTVCLILTAQHMGII